MPSAFRFDVSPERFSVRLSSARSSPRYMALDDRNHQVISMLANRIHDHAKLLAVKTSKTSIFVDELPFDDDQHCYKAILLSKDTAGKNAVLVEGGYEVSSSRSEAKRKALEGLLKKSAEKVKEAMEKPKAVTGGGRWIFLPD